MRIDEFSALPDGSLSSYDTLRFLTVGFDLEFSPVVNPTGKNDLTAPWATGFYWNDLEYTYNDLSGVYNNLTISPRNPNPAWAWNDL